METGYFRPIEILLVEDSEPDVRLTMEALHEAKVRNRLSGGRGRRRGDGFSAAKARTPSAGPT